jgi:hypothetical protein
MNFPNILLADAMAYLSQFEEAMKLSLGIKRSNDDVDGAWVKVELADSNGLTINFDIEGNYDMALNSDSFPQMYEDYVYIADKGLYQTLYGTSKIKFLYYFLSTVDFC